MSHTDDWEGPLFAFTVPRKPALRESLKMI